MRRLRGCVPTPDDPKHPVGNERQRATRSGRDSPVAGPAYARDDEILRINEELRIHQAELEAQNQALRSAQLELEESRRRYAQLFDLAPVGYLELDERGTIVEANQVADSILQSRTPLAGRHLARFLSQDQADELHLHLAVVKASRQRETCTLCFPALGDVGPRDIRIDSIVVATAGENVRIQTCLLDVTEQMKAQQESRRLASELEVRVQRRTQELTQADEELRKEVEARRQAERRLAVARKLEAVGRLAGGLAHDLNNVMTVISMNAALLQASIPKDSELRVLVDEMVVAADRAVALPRQLLVFSRRQPSDHEVVEIGKTVEALGAMLSRLLGHARITLGVQSEDDTWVNLGRSQQEQIILNLIFNARDAMPEGGNVLLRCTNRRVEEHGPPIIPGARPIDYVVVGVSDTGTGMDAETRDRMFEPFFTTKAQGEGAGLGLATVYALATSVGGFVHVETEPGRGTRVDVYLPRVAPPAGARTVEPGESLAKPDSSLATKARILLVDDEVSIVRLVSRLLSNRGYDVLAATSGEEALNIATEMQGSGNPLDVLVTDVAMPQMSGPQLSKALRDQGIRVPTLFISGFVGSALTEESEFLQKPFKPQELLDTLARMLEASENPSSTASR